MLLGCYVTFDDFIKVKKKALEDNGDVMTEDNYLQEEIKFRFMDKDSSGSITWNQFLQYETASLIARKNKVILAFVRTIFIWLFYLFLRTTHFN